MPQQRLDSALVERGVCESREKARLAVLAGRVTVNRQPAKKPSDQVRPSDLLELASPEKYVSRGGLKLEGALEAFQLGVSGLMAVDIGASTGGFTDCLLQHGAEKVFAVDVGHGQLAWKLRQDPRVVVMERVNARDLSSARFPQPFRPLDLAVVDCSFISLTKILPIAVELLGPSGKILALIKPQFEAGKSEADKGRGVITDPAIHRRVLRELEDFAGTLPAMRWLGSVESLLLGPAGNREFFALMQKSSPRP